DRLADAHGADLIWCPETGIMVWKGTHWEPDPKRVECLAEQVLLRIFPEIGDLSDKDERNTLFNFVNASLSRKGIGNMVYTVQRKLRRMPITAFDANPFLLNVRNGVIDLRTGMRRAHKRTDYSTIVIPYDHDLKAVCPVFDKFLLRILGGSTDLVR